MTIKGWPDSRRPVEPIGGLGPGYPDVGNISGLPNIARRLNRLHPINAGLCGWWPMDEMQGTRIRDLSIYGNHGTLTNAADPPTATSGWGAGVSQRELAFDGTDDAVTVPTATQIQITSDISVCGWVNIPAFSSYYVMAEKGPSYPAPFAIVTEPGGTVEWLRGNGGSQSYVISLGAITAGLWQFIVGTWTGGVFRIYLNGRFDNSVSSSPACTDDGQSLYIGKRRDGVARLPGRIQHIRIYNRALSAAAIAQLHADKWIGSIGGIT